MRGECIWIDEDINSENYYKICMIHDELSRKYLKLISQIENNELILIGRDKKYSANRVFDIKSAKKNWEMRCSHINKFIS